MSIKAYIFYDDEDHDNMQYILIGPAVLDKQIDVWALEFEKQLRKEKKARNKVWHKPKNEELTKGFVKWLVNVKNFKKITQFAAYSHQEINKVWTSEARKTLKKLP
jgi:hypothetical protein